MTIKDQLTDEELLRNSFPHVPDDGRDHTRRHLDRLHAAPEKSTVPACACTRKAGGLR